MNQEVRYHDEIDLMDIFRTIKESWRLITVLFLLTVLVVGSVTYFFVPKKYLSYATFFLQAEGSFSSRFVSAAMTKELVRSDEFIRNILKQLGSLGTQEEVTGLQDILRIEETEAKNIKMELIWDDPRMAQSILRVIYDGYQKEIENQIEVYVAGTVKVAQEQYTRNKEEFERVSRSLADFQKKHNIFFIPPQLAISDRYYSEMKAQLANSPQALIEYEKIMMEQATAKENYIKAYDFLEDTRRIVSIERNHNFVTINPPVLPDKKYSPSTVMNMIIAGLLALLVGVMLAFLREYLRSYKEREQR